MTHITCGLTAKNLYQLRNPTLGSRVWASFTYTCDIYRRVVSGRAWSSVCVCCVQVSVQLTTSAPSVADTADYYQCVVMVAAAQQDVVVAATVSHDQRRLSCRIPLDLLSFLNHHHHNASGTQLATCIGAHTSLLLPAAKDEASLSSPVPFEVAP